MYKHSYLWALIGILAVPTLIMYFYLRESIILGNMIFILAVLGCAGVAADIWATKQNKKDKTWIWEFNTKNIVSLKILGHPAEEYVYFLLFIPYIILFWELLNKIVPENSNLKDMAISLFVLLWVHLTALYLYTYQKHRIRKRYTK